MRELLADRRFLAVVAVLFAINLAIANGTTPLFDQDEAAYAGFAHTMVETGEWRVPSFLWSDHHRKPPLHLWTMALSIAGLGPTPFAVRLPTTFAFVATCVLLALWGIPLFGRTRALGACLVLATSLLPVFGKLALTDGLLLLTETAAALALLRHMDGGGRRWAVAMWIAVAAGLMVKGPPVLLLVLGMGAVLAVAHARRRQLLALHPWFGLPLACLPLVAWGWSTWGVDGGETVRWMIDWYVLRRAGGSVFGQTGPPGYYLLVFVVLLLPWSALLPAGLVRVARGVRARDGLALGLLAWMAAGWLLYEVLPSKLPAYALGAAPALALAVAGAGLGRREGDRQGGLWIAGWIGQGVLLLALGGALAMAAATFPGTGASSIAAAGAALGAIGVLSAAMALRGGRGVKLRLLSLGMMLFFLMSWVAFLPAARPLLATTAEVAARVSALAGEDGEAVFARNFRLPSLPFYLGASGVPYRECGEDEEPAALLGQASPVVIVFDAPGYLEAETRLPTSGLVIETIAGWIPDKGQPIRYWIVANRGSDPAEQGSGGERGENPARVPAHP